MKNKKTKIKEIKRTKEFELYKVLFGKSFVPVLESCF